MQLWPFVVAVLILLLAVGVRWLFRQRTPEEIRAAQEKLRRFWGKQ